MFQAECIDSAFAMKLPIDGTCPREGFLTWSLRRCTMEQDNLNTAPTPHILLSVLIMITQVIKALTGIMAHKLASDIVAFIWTFHIIIPAITTGNTPTCIPQGLIPVHPTWHIIPHGMSHITPSTPRMHRHTLSIPISQDMDIIGQQAILTVGPKTSLTKSKFDC